MVPSIQPNKDNGRIIQPMVSRVKTIAFQGIQVLDIEVQVQITNGLPAFNIVGLPDKAVGESRERVRSTLQSIGLSLPAKRVTVNLAPADVAKEGSHYDLPIALALLAIMEVLPEEDLLDCVVLGELGLDGTIRPVNGVLPAAIHAVSQGCRLVCPKACGREAAWAGDLEILAPHDLLQLINHLKGTQLLEQPEAWLSEPERDYDAGPDMANIKGQETAKRALEVAAAGGHNLLMIGPPGAGKSMLAHAMPGILPDLTPSESLEVSMIHSLAGSLPEGGLLRRRPFRDPHHSASLPAIIGGGQKAKPGEIALAHKGILFLDELPEFARATLESLRQPLETGKALIARVNHHVTYPARFQLIAAMNPCRCGYLGQTERECTRAPRCGTDYQAKISGPLLDRIDLCVELPAVAFSDLAAPAKGEHSAAVSARVAQARAAQAARANTLKSSKSNDHDTNSTLSGEEIERTANLSEDARTLMTQSAEKLRLSARGYYRLLRVARTIADLDNANDCISKIHIAEALSYRRLVS